MKNLAVGVFHDEQLGRELGKKGTESDIAMFNKKTDDHIFTFLSSVGDKLTEKMLVYTRDDTFLLLNLNAKKLHIMGHGKVTTSS
jgi:hypothetical protein